MNGTEKKALNALILNMPGPDVPLVWPVTDPQEAPANNHEIWRVCATCGEWLDLRYTATCGVCGAVYED